MSYFYNKNLNINYIILRLILQKQLVPILIQFKHSVLHTLTYLFTLKIQKTQQQLGEAWESFFYFSSISTVFIYKKIRYLSNKLDIWKIN